MIAAKCFGQEWISAKAEELRYPDKNVIERVVHGKAFHRNTSLNASVKISSLNTSHGSYEKRQADESEFSRI